LCSEIDVGWISVFLEPNLLQFHPGDVGLISAQLHPILIEILK